MNEPLSVLAAARERPSHPALVDAGRPVSYAELAAEVRVAIAWLGERGVRPGRPDRVAVLAQPDRATIVLLLALIEIGVAFVPLHPRLTDGERAKIVEDAKPILTVLDVAAEVATAGDASPPAQMDAPADAPLAILYTSGTTGRSKGAILSRAAFVAAAAASEANLGWRDDDRWLLCMPIAHVGGLSLVLRCLIARKTVVLGGAKFSVDAVETAIARDRVTIASLVPTMLHQMLERGWRCPSYLRVVLLGGAATSAPLLDRAREAAIPALTTYGLTEACAQVTTQRYGTPPGAEQGAGSPLPGIELRIVDDEIQVKSPARMTGYFPLGAVPNPFTEDGWLKTGDLGRLDAEGRLHLLARRTDLIVTGGENVYPAEVETILESLPGVSAACVFSVPDDRWGHVVGAALVVHDTHRGASLDGILAGAKALLATYKRPRLAAIVEALPTNRSGKVDRAAARELVATKLAPVAYPS